VLRSLVDDHHASELPARQRFVASLPRMHGRPARGDKAMTAANARAVIAMSVVVTTIATIWVFLISGSKISRM
jgi:hypothetical protein